MARTSSVNNDDLDSASRRSSGRSRKLTEKFQALSGSKLLPVDSANIASREPGSASRSKAVEHSAEIAKIGRRSSTSQAQSRPSPTPPFQTSARKQRRTSKQAQIVEPDTPEEPEKRSLRRERKPTAKFLDSIGATADSEEEVDQAERVISKNQTGSTEHHKHKPSVSPPKPSVIYDDDLIPPIVEVEDEDDHDFKPRTSNRTSAKTRSSPVDTSLKPDRRSTRRKRSASPTAEGPRAKARRSGSTADNPCMLSRISQSPVTSVIERSEPHAEKQSEPRRPRTSGLSVQEPDPDAAGTDNHELPTISRWTQSRTTYSPQEAASKPKKPKAEDIPFRFDPHLGLKIYTIALPPPRPKAKTRKTTIPPPRRPSNLRFSVPAAADKVDTDDASLETTEIKSSIRKSQRDVQKPTAISKTSKPQKVVTLRYGVAPAKLTEMRDATPIRFATAISSPNPTESTNGKCNLFCLSPSSRILAFAQLAAESTDSDDEDSESDGEAVNTRPSSRGLYNKWIERGRERFCVCNKANTAHGHPSLRMTAVSQLQGDQVPNGVGTSPTKDPMLSNLREDADMPLELPPVNSILPASEGRRFSALYSIITDIPYSASGLRRKGVRQSEPVRSKSDEERISEDSPALQAIRQQTDMEGVRMRRDTNYGLVNVHLDGHRTGASNGIGDRYGPTSVKSRSIRR